MPEHWMIAVAHGANPGAPLEREGSLRDSVRLQAASDLLVQPQWFAVYTCANHEKRVAEQFTNRGIAHFLPQYDTMSRWKDRRVLLQRPLFPGYLFVQLALRNRLQVQQVPGVVGLVGFNGAPTAIEEIEIARVRDLLGSGLRAEPHPFLTVGRRVRVKRGPLTGLEGILLRRKSRLRFVISVELIQRSMAVEMDEGDLEPLSTRAANA
jgi:transcription antitermination factor NusG